MDIKNKLKILSVPFVICIVLAVFLIVWDCDNKILRERVELLEKEPKVSLMFEYYDMYNHQFKSQFAIYELKRMSSQEHTINNRFKVLSIMVSRE